MWYDYISTTHDDEYYSVVGWYDHHSWPPLLVLDWSAFSLHGTTSPSLYGVWCSAIFLPLYDAITPRLTVEDTTRYISLLRLSSLAWKYDQFFFLRLVPSFRQSVLIPPFRLVSRWLIKGRNLCHVSPFLPQFTTRTSFFKREVRLLLYHILYCIFR